MKLILDDETNPQWRSTRADIVGGETYVWVSTVLEALDVVTGNQGAITHLTVDNDLGEGTPEGHVLLDTIEQAVYTDPSFIPPRLISVHSKNASRLQSMRVTAQQIMEKGATRW